MTTREIFVSRPAEPPRTEKGLNDDIAEILAAPDVVDGKLPHKEDWEEELGKLKVTKARGGFLTGWFTFDEIWPEAQQRIKDWIHAYKSQWEAEAWEKGYWSGAKHCETSHPKQRPEDHKKA